MAPKSPGIVGLTWGSVETKAGAFRDAKLWPGGEREWDWSETGTHHVPGVQPSDVEEVLAHGAKVVVLGCGQHGRLRVTDDTLRMIERHGATAEVLRTGAAVARYQDLVARGAAVGALIHSTC